MRLCSTGRKDAIGLLEKTQKVSMPMTLKEAIKLIENVAKTIWIPFGPSEIRDRGYASLQIIDALLASQKAMKLLALNDSRIIGKLKQDVRDAHKREREVFKRLSCLCAHRWKNECNDSNNDGMKCTLRTCPLLKGDDL